MTSRRREVLTFVRVSRAETRARASAVRCFHWSFSAPPHARGGLN